MIQVLNVPAWRRQEKIVVSSCASWSTRLGGTDIFLADNLNTVAWSLFIGQDGQPIAHNAGTPGSSAAA